MNNKATKATKELSLDIKKAFRKAGDWKFEKKPALKDWCWIVDFSNAIGQNPVSIAPVVFKSRGDARKYNDKVFPKGSVKQIKPIQVVKSTKLYLNKNCKGK